MFVLRAIIILPILVAVILADSSSDSDEHFFDQNPLDQDPTPCNHNPNKPNHLPPCSVTTKSTTTTTTEQDNSGEQTTKLNDVEDPLDDVSALESAHWCRFTNGTYVPYNHRFLHTPCSLCRCTKSRSFRCQPLECMATYCSDNSRPYRPEGQCCTRCASDPPSNSCLFNGTTYPHGVILKAVQGQMQCWCQHGTVECRQYIGTLFDGFNVLSNGVVTYVIVIVILMLIFFGLLICCGCTTIIYYYYQKNQQGFQEAYDQYVNSAGWQPMEEDETVVDSIAEEKRLEAEQNQYYNGNQGAIPPPYDVYNGAYVSGQKIENKNFI